MFKQLKRAALGLALAVTTLGAATTAEARDRYGRHGDGDDAAIAIGAGIVGLAIGAAIADRDDDRYYDDGYYRHRRYVRVSGYPDYYYYYDGYPNRYYRDRYYSRNHYPRYRSSYRYRNYDRWDRGYRYNNRRYNNYYGNRGHRYGHSRGDWGRQRGHRGPGR